MSQPTYQFSNATKTILENQFQVFSTLTNYFIEATEKLSDLNMAVVKASVDESSETAKQLLSVKDQAELLSFISEQPKLMSEKLHFYNQHVAQISSDVKSNVDKVLAGQVIQAKDNVTTFVSELTKNAPEGSDKVLTVLKAAMDQTGVGYEQMQKTAKQVTETMAKVSEQFMQSVENSSIKTSRKKN